MAQTTLKVGDDVKLKSGGPIMSVNSIKTSQVYGFGVTPTELDVNQITVQWFDEKKNLQSGEFAEPQLEKLNNI